MGQKLAHYEIKNQTAMVTIDHPPMNALDVATKEAIGEVFAELDGRRQEIRAVILHGAGERAFAVGADIRAFLELTPDISKRRLSRSHQIYGMVENFEWPVIAAIHGFCLGGGLELALCCDIRYAEETAKFGFPEVNLSVFPGNGGIPRSMYHIPIGKLKELVYSGEMEECDLWSLASHQKACAAIEAGKFKEEIVPVPISTGKKESIIVDQDEGPRADTTLEKLSQLKPVLGGVCTAGNSSSENDGAAAVVVTSAEKARELGLEPFSELKSFAVVGDDPRRTYKTVPKAVSQALKKANLTIDQMDLIEIQEAFAAQVLVDLKEMGMTSKDYHKINVNGSGISLGHPVGCTGTRVLVTLLYEMRRRNACYGLECICGGGGLGIAAVFERGQI